MNDLGDDPQGNIADLLDFDDPQAIPAKFINEDGQRLQPMTDYGPIVRAMLEAGQTFVPLAKPRRKSDGWRRNKRRDFTLRRALALLVGGYGLSVRRASAVIYAECAPLVSAMGKSPQHPNPIGRADAIRDLWERGGHKDDLKARAQRVADWPILFAVLAGMDEHDFIRENLKREKLRRKGGCFFPPDF